MSDNSSPHTPTQVDELNSNTMDSNPKSTASPDNPNPDNANNDDKDSVLETVPGQTRKDNANAPCLRPSTASSKSTSALHAARLKGLEQQQKERRRSAGAADSVQIQVVKDPYGPARDSKDSVRRGTGVVYDMVMGVHHFSPWDPGHPERPERFASVIQRCHELGLLDRCIQVPSRSATLQELTQLHTPEHIAILAEISSLDRLSDSSPTLETKASQFDSVYFNSQTYNLACLAAGSTLDLVRGLIGPDPKFTNGMAIVRPPGHHAGEDEYCGYCFFNNVALAAKMALDSPDSGIKRILIIDWDAHHGQASQRTFWNDPRVLYFSTHRYEYGQFWPNLEESNWNWVGPPPGTSEAGQNSSTGTNVNIPLNTTGMGNSEFLTLWYKVLIPMAYKFNPDLVLVSAGYDAALGCPEGEMCLIPQAFPHLLSPLLALAGGRIAVVLEGGYCLKSLAEGAALTLRTLLKDPCPLISPLATNLPPNPLLLDIIFDISSLLNAVRPLWTSLSTLNFLGNDETEEWQEMKDSGRAYKLARPKYTFDLPRPTTWPTRDCHPIQSMDRILALDKELDHLQATTDLRLPTHQVGLIYDDRMLSHRSWPSSHPECPERTSNIWACHGNFGLIDRCHRIPARAATKSELQLLHKSNHVRLMETTAKLSPKEAHTFGETFNSIYFNAGSWDSACLAAGSVIEAVKSVVGPEPVGGGHNSNSCGSAVAIVRPPGHHAEVDKPYGFCLFNNVALGAKWALENCGLKRILIVDWDVHHGNGIQRMFYSDPRVLYVSIHRYDHGSFFPCSSDADYCQVGTGPGLGYNLNIPWNRKGMGDTEYMAAFLNIILPVAYEFGPELVLVSAGFDAAVGDPLGGCKVTPECYGHMTHLLSSLANGRIILVLEGGYNLTSISYSMTLCTKALLGDPLPRLQLNDTVHETALESLQNVIRVHGAYWKSLGIFKDVVLPPPSVVLEIVPLGQYPGTDVKAKEAEDFEGLMTKLTLADEGEEQIPDSDRENANIPESSEEQPQAAGFEPTATTFNLEIVQEFLGGYIADPLSWCPHLEPGLSPIPIGFEVDVKAPCDDCGSSKENWICLTCYKVYCSRYVREHMVQHSAETGHPLALSFSDLSVWCFPCDSYVRNVVLKPFLDAAYHNKFGTEDSEQEARTQ